jgi:hypothetical protein
MNQNNLAEIPSELFLDTVAQGDCVELMRQMPVASVDFILTDPPYLVNYRSRDGRVIRNDTDDRWLRPAFAEAYRVLRSNRFCVCFYGWSKADTFIAAWRGAGFRPVGHLVFRKCYASTTRFLRYQHEQAYLLAKGEPKRPEHPISDVLEIRYTGNRLVAPSRHLLPHVGCVGISSQWSSMLPTMGSQHAGYKSGPPSDPGRALPFLAGLSFARTPRRRIQPLCSALA